MFCPNCGTKISKDSKFCDNCGFNLSELNNNDIKSELPPESHKLRIPWFSELFEMTLSEVLQHIKHFVIVALISASITAIYSLLGIYGFNIYSFLDVLLILILLTLTYFMKSRAAATFMVLYWIYNLFFFQIPKASGPFSLLISLTFLYFYFMGMIATYVFHAKYEEHKKQTVEETQGFIKWYHRVWFIIVASIINPLFGLIFLWISPIVKKRIKIPITIIFVIYIFASYMTPYLSQYKYSPEKSPIETLSQIFFQEKGNSYLPIYIMPPGSGIKLLTWDDITSEAIQEFSTKQIAWFKNAVVLIKTFDNEGRPLGTGSGFIINPDGFIITNYHVIANAYSAKILLANNETIEDVKCVKEYTWPTLDYAVLKVNPLKDFCIIGNSDSVVIGDKVIAIGNPLGFSGSVSEGIVSEIRSIGKGVKLFQITNPISPGSSGGPLFNTKGEVIGITTLASMRGEAQQLNFAIPINYLRKGYYTNLEGSALKVSKGEYAYGYVEALVNPEGEKQCTMIVLIQAKDLSLVLDNSTQWIKTLKKEGDQIIGQFNVDDEESNKYYKPYFSNRPLKMPYVSIVYPNGTNEIIFFLKVDYATALKLCKIMEDSFNSYNKAGFSAKIIAPQE